MCPLVVLVEVPRVFASDVASLEEGSGADAGLGSTLATGRILGGSRLSRDGHSDHRIESHGRGSDSDNSSIANAVGDSSRGGRSRGGSRSAALSAVARSSLAIDVDKELVLELLLDGVVVVVRLIREGERSQSVRDRSSLDTTDKLLTLDFDGRAAGVELSGGDIVGSKSALVPLEAGGEIGELAVLGGCDGRLLEGRPGPDPIQGVLRVLGEVLRQLDGRLAPDILTVGLGSLVGELTLALLRDGLVIDLVALAVIVVASGQQSTTSIAALAIGGPLSMNIEEGIRTLGLGGTVDEYSTTVERLVGGGVRDRDVAVLLVAKGDKVTRSSCEGRKAVNLLAQSLLAHRKAITRDTVGKRSVVEGSRLAAGPSTGEAIRTNKGSVGCDLVELLDPGVR